MKIEAVALENAWVRLEPCVPPLKDELRAALDVEPEVWALMVGTGQGEHFEAWWRAALDQTAAGTRTAYAVRSLASGTLVGTTSLYDIRPEHRRCELGATFYRSEARGGVVNPSCKRLLLGHAFVSGRVRDTALYAVLDRDWPGVRDRLDARLNAFS